ncbi:MAG: putative abductin-like protein [Myxococcaceae bacterium]|nr:putative abductin-like protein [Myxococcaceae bacterium]
MSRHNERGAGAVVAVIALGLGVDLLSGCLHRRRAPVEADETNEPAPEVVSKPVAPPADPLNVSRSPARNEPTEHAAERVIRGSAELGEVTRTEGSGDVEPVARIIRGQLGGMRACYERELRRDPSVKGRLDVHFTLGPSGRVLSLWTGGVDGTPSIGSCVSGRIRGLVFPSSDASSTFTAPITLAPGS